MSGEKESLVREMDCGWVIAIEVGHERQVSKKLTQAELRTALRRAMGDEPSRLPEGEVLGGGTFCVVWEQQRHTKRKIQSGNNEREEAAEGPHNAWALVGMMKTWNFTLR